MEPMRVAAEREEPNRDRAGRRDVAMTIALCAAGVVAMAYVQYRLVLDMRPPLLAAVIPAAVGVVFGALVASIGASRARERSMARQLAIAQQARFEAMTRLAGAVGHDLGNVFTATVSCAACVREVAAARRDGACRECLATLDDLDESVARARNIARQLVMLARPSGAAPERLDLGEVVRDLAPMLRRLLGAAVRLEVLAPGEAPVRVDRTEVEQLVLNLAVNGRDAMPEGGTLAIAVRREGPAAVLAVRDSGVGMDDELRSRIFEPFFTTKPAGKGTGLGLAVVAQVAQRASARLAVRSAPREGTEISVAFPLAGNGDASAAA
jgi:signal transduction histidine kinase